MPLNCVPAPAGPRTPAHGAHSRPTSFVVRSTVRPFRALAVHVMCAQLLQQSTISATRCRSLGVTGPAALSRLTKRRSLFDQTVVLHLVERCLTIDSGAAPTPACNTPVPVFRAIILAGP